MIMLGTYGIVLRGLGSGYRVRDYMQLVAPRFNLCGGERQGPVPGKKIKIRVASLPRSLARSRLQLFAYKVPGTNS